MHASVENQYLGPRAGRLPSRLWGRSVRLERFRDRREKEGAEVRGDILGVLPVAGVRGDTRNLTVGTATPEVERDGRPVAVVIDLQVPRWLPLATCLLVEPDYVRNTGCLQAGRHEPIELLPADPATTCFAQERSIARREALRESLLRRTDERLIRWDIEIVINCAVAGETQTCTEGRLAPRLRAHDPLLLANGAFH